MKSIICKFATSVLCLLTVAPANVTQAGLLDWTYEVYAAEPVDGVEYWVLYRLKDSSGTWTELGPYSDEESAAWALWRIMEKLEYEVKLEERPREPDWFYMGEFEEFLDALELHNELLEAGFLAAIHPVAHTRDPDDLDLRDQILDEFLRELDQFLLDDPETLEFLESPTLRPTDPHILDGGGDDATSRFR